MTPPTRLLSPSSAASLLSPSPAGSAGWCGVSPAAGASGSAAMRYSSYCDPGGKARRRREASGSAFLIVLRFLRPQCSQPGQHDRARCAAERDACALQARQCQCWQGCQDHCQHIGWQHQPIARSRPAAPWLELHSSQTRTARGGHARIRSGVQTSDVCRQRIRATFEY